VNQNKIVKSLGGSGDRFQQGKGSSPGDIVDGMSNTLCVSEVIATDGFSTGTNSPDIRGVWFSPGMGASIFSTFTGPNSRVNDIIPSCDDQILLTDPQDKLACTSNNTDENVYAAARSYHTGGVNALMCDGSVRFISENIDLTSVWQAIGTRQGGETTGDF
jgi:prepilin-type processing-associated H-X9-DG protein